MLNRDNNSDAMFVDGERKMARRKALYSDTVPSRSHVASPLTRIAMPYQGVPASGPLELEHEMLLYSGTAKSLGF